MIARQRNDGIWLQECAEPNCRSTSFHFLLHLHYPVLECAECGRRHVMVDYHTKLPVGHMLIAASNGRDMHCPACGGRGFEPGKPAQPCKACSGSGLFDLRSKRYREEAAKKKIAKKEVKGLDPRV